MVIKNQRGFNVRLSDDTILFHPEVSCLPKRLWELFDNELSDSTLDLMRAESSNLEGLIAQMDITGLDEPSKIKIWFAMAFSHQEMSDELLFNRAEQLGMTPELIFQVAVNYGKMPFFRYLIARFPDVLRAMILASQNSDIFFDAITMGNLELINRLLEVCTANNLWEGDIDHLYLAFFYAADGGHLNIMNRLVEVCPSEYLQAMIQNRGYQAFKGAAVNGHIDVMNRIMGLCTPDNLIVMIQKSTKAPDLSSAVMHAILNHIVEVCNDDDLQAIIQDENYWLFCSTTVYFLPSVISRLYELCAPDRQRIMVYQSLKWVAVYGNVEILRYFIDTYDWVSDMILTNKEELLHFARPNSTSNNMYDYLLSFAAAEIIEVPVSTPDPESSMPISSSTPVGAYTVASHAVFFAGESEVLPVPDDTNTPSSIPR